jgi:hypothetical protein
MVLYYGIHSDWLNVCYLLDYEELGLVAEKSRYLVKGVRRGAPALERGYQNDVILEEGIYLHASRREENSSVETGIRDRGSEAV